MRYPSSLIEPWFYLLCLFVCLFAVSSLSLTIDSMKEKLSATPLVTQIPLGQGKEFAGLIDLLSMDVLLWERRGRDHTSFQRIPLLKASSGEGRDFSKIPSILGSSWTFGDVPVSKEVVKEAVDQRSHLAEQVLECELAKWLSLCK